MHLQQIHTFFPTQFHQYFRYKISDLHDIDMLQAHNRIIKIYNLLSVEFSTAIEYITFPFWYTHLIS